MNNNKDFCRKYHTEILKYDANALARRILGKDIFGQHYDRPVLTAQEGNERLAECIRSGKPFMAGKFGGNEIRTISDVLFERAGGRLGGLSDRTRYKITNQAGFFPNERAKIEKLVDTYLEACKDVDILAVWNMFLSARICSDYLQHASLVYMTSIEPFYFDNPWSSELKGKKVLIIHPFTETIEKQYEKRSLLFDNKEMLPDFELKTVKAVQTIAGKKDERFADWFEALDYMYEEAMKQDFDIALLGCGAYGFPLAARLKRAGRQAVHIGGGLQILFGIRGNRWDSNEPIAKLYNDNWVRPSDSEKVDNTQIVEGSCYW